VNGKEITEHGASMYRRRGCRCDVCRVGMSQTRKKYRPLAMSSDVRLDAKPLIEFLTKAEQLQYLDKHTVARWWQNGLSVYTADKWCLRFGLHPAEIFGHKFYEGCFDSE
jgi:hypothetical protein